MGWGYIYNNERWVGDIFITRGGTERYMATRVSIDTSLSWINEGC